MPWLAPSRSNGVGPAVPGDGAGHVVVGQHPGGGRADGGVVGERASIDRAQLGGVPGQAQEGEVEGGVQLVRAAGSGRSARCRAARPRRSRTRPGYSSAICAPGPVDLVHAVAVGVRVRRVRRTLGQRRVLGQQRRRSRCGRRRRRGRTRTAGRPRTPARTSGLAQLKSGCSGANRCRYHSPACRPARRPGPGGAAEDRRPVVGREFAVLAAPGPEPEQLALGEPGPAASAAAEPGVPVRAVVRHDVDDRPDAELVGLGDQLLGLGEGAEGGVDGAVVGDVVAAVRHRRGVPRAEPDGVDAEVGEVGQPGRARRPGRRCRPRRRRRSCARTPGRWRRTPPRSQQLGCPTGERFGLRSRVALGRGGSALEAARGEAGHDVALEDEEQRDHRMLAITRRR